jgi:dGTPase
MNVKETTQYYERMMLSDKACLSENSRGRERPDVIPCLLRTDFQRDRDRIIHCPAFRRLKHKTSVFILPKSEQYRTRLTHTLEVSQIARTIARALRLNEDLTEAIALGHDLGHTPFGHDGEYALREAMRDYGGFAHNEQSVRVAEVIEEDGQGMNLTAEVRDGIRNHKTSSDKAMTLEAHVVRLADKIAYINHDIEDAVLAGVIKDSDLPAESVRVLGDTKNKRITTLITSIVDTFDDMPRYSPEVQTAHDLLRDFMYTNVYPICNRIQKQKVRFVVHFLFEHFLKQPEQMPDLFRRISEKDGVPRAVADFISCMTDDSAVDLFSEICIPNRFVASGKYPLGG